MFVFTWRTSTSEEEKKIGEARKTGKITLNKTSFFKIHIKVDLHSHWQQLYQHAQHHSIINSDNYAASLNSSISTHGITQSAIQ